MNCTTWKRTSWIGLTPVLLAGLLAVGASAAGAATQTACALDPAERPRLLKDFDNHDGVLEVLALPNCLGDKVADAKAPVVERFNAITETKAPSTGQRLEGVRQALEALSLHARDYPWKTELGKSTGLAYSLELQQALTRESSAVTNSTKATEPDLLKVETSTARLRSFDTSLPRSRWRDLEVTQQHRGRAEFAGQRVELLARTGCNPATSACDRFDDQVELIRLYNLILRLRGYMQYDTLKTALETADLMLRRWEAYRTKARPQYWWEVFVNGSRMGDDECPRDANRNPIGYCQVPTSQIILAHPDTVLVFNHKAKNGKDLEAAFFVDLVGYHSWKWKAKSDEMEERFGYALSAAYVRHDDKRRWAFGPSLMFGGHRLAVTRAPGNRWSVLVNLDLAGDYFGRKQEAIDWLKAAKGKFESANF